MNEISRKDFFKEVFSFFKNELEKGESRAKLKLQPFVPPPGIESTDHYLQSCTKCFDCIAACPPMALEVCRDRSSNFYGYPVIEPARQACAFCEDYPCIEACSTPALQKNNRKAVIVRAAIMESRCLAWQGHFCISCLNACSSHVAAIALNAEGKPQIKSDQCNACGLCAGVCPAPKNAIEFYIQ